MNSLRKSVPVSSFWLATVLGGLLTAQFLPAQLQRVEQSQMQLVEPHPVRIEDSDSVENSAWLLATLALGAGAAMLGIKATSKGAPARTMPSRAAVSLNQTSYKLQRKLLSLLHDDRTAANRLLTQAKLRHPEWSADWCAEKVIYDLQRDRH